MSEAALRTEGSMEAQRKMGGRNLHNKIYCPRSFFSESSVGFPSKSFR